MKLIFLIGLGGFIGTIFRYVIFITIQQKLFSEWPHATFVVNILGSLLIGIIYALSEKGSISTEWRLFIATGILGGFTTFSAFSNETVNMLRNSQLMLASVYVLTSVVIGIVATFAGIWLTRLF